MTDTVKINVVFYDIKINTIDFDFIYLLLNVPNESATLVLKYTKYIKGGGVRGDLVVNGSTISAMTLSHCH